MHSISNQPNQGSNNRAGPKLVPISFSLTKRSLDARRRQSAENSKTAITTCIGLRVVGITAIAFFFLHFATAGWEGTSVEFILLHDYVPMGFAIAVAIEIGIYGLIYRRL